MTGKTWSFAAPNPRIRVSTKAHKFRHGLWCNGKGFDACSTIIQGAADLAEHPGSRPMARATPFGHGFEVGSEGWALRQGLGLVQA